MICCKRLRIPRCQLHGDGSGTMYRVRRLQWFVWLFGWRKIYDVEYDEEIERAATLKEIQQVICEDGWTIDG